MNRIAQYLHRVSRLRGPCGLLLLAMIGACTPSDRTPDGILDRERFTEVLLEATLIEARMNHELVTEQRASIPMDRYYAELFAEKKMTREEFEKSFDHYAARPAEMASIYEDVLTELSRRKDEALQRPKAPVTKADTLATDSANVRNR